MNYRDYMLLKLNAGRENLLLATQDGRGARIRSRTMSEVQIQAAFRSPVPAASSALTKRFGMASTTCCMRRRSSTRFR